MRTRRRPRTTRADGSTSGDDYDAIVIGGGHNGLIAAAYLARAGRSTLLIEARQEVGGTATSEPFSGVTVNVCNCDHLTFRTTPVVDELDLASHGLTYHDVDPAQHLAAWSDGTLWTQYHDIEATLDGLAGVLPGEVEGYRRYLGAALPAARMVLEAAAEPPTLTSLTRRAIRHRFAGSSALLGWSRRSAADVLRSYFQHDALTAGAAVGGPMVWGVSPEFVGSGLGALSMATRHVGQVGRPVGGSVAMPRAVLAAFQGAGGELLAAMRATEIVCEGERVRGVRLEDGTLRTASIVVSACDPHRTFLHWLTNPPPAA
ncbi:MAG TPA: NAD(P)/FAD-dependent oxidoreductase, partial [Ilumatobacter sp.]|nr:NAD(P)/FAD-dependent oxidoreductase [Ilumatobacter sp.]